MRLTTILAALMLFASTALADGSFYAFGTSFGEHQASTPCTCTWTADEVPKRVCECDPGECVYLEMPFPRGVAGECVGGAFEEDPCTAHATCTDGRCAAPLTIPVLARTSSVVTTDKAYVCTQMQVGPPPAEWGLVNGASAVLGCAGAFIPAAALSGIELLPPAIEADDASGAHGSGLCSPDLCGGYPGILVICNPQLFEEEFPDQSTAPIEFYFTPPTWSTQ